MWLSKDLRVRVKDSIALVESSKFGSLWKAYLELFMGV